MHRLTVSDQVGGPGGAADGGDQAVHNPGTPADLGGTRVSRPAMLLRRGQRHHVPPDDEEVKRCSGDDHDVEHLVVREDSRPQPRSVRDEEDHPDGVEQAAGQDESDGEPAEALDHGPEEEDLSLIHI